MTRSEFDCKMEEISVKDMEVSAYQNLEALAEKYKTNILKEIERLNKLCMIQSQ